MDERQIVQLSLFVMVAGIGIIFYATISFEPPVIDANTVTFSMSGEQVSVCGIIENYKSGKSGAVFFSLDGLDVVFFRDGALAADVSVDDGDSVCVSGTIESGADKVSLVGRNIGNY